MSTFTPNKGIEQPASASYVNAWATPVNTDWGIIDTAFGGTTSISVTGVAAGTYAFSLSQYQPPNIEFSGVLSALLNYQIPAGVGGTWSINNSTTGAFALLVSIASGNSIIVGAGRTLIVSNGASISLADGGNIAAQAGAAEAAAISAAAASAASLYALYKSGSFTPVWGGFSSPPSVSLLPYWISGNLATIQLPGTVLNLGTSNSPAFTLGGLPSAIIPSGIRVVPVIGAVNNLTNVSGAAMAVINNPAGEIQFYPDGAGSNWTSSGSKGFSFQTSIIYPL